MTGIDYSKLFLLDQHGRPKRCKYCTGALDLKGVCTVCGKQTPMPEP